MKTLLALLTLATATVSSAFAAQESPKPIEQPAPRYAVELRQKGLEGKVLVEYKIDTQGRVSQVKVLKSSNHVFISPTVKALRNWRFSPAQKNGQPVETTARQEIEFTLEKS